MAKLHYGKLNPATITATTSQPGYGAMNLATPYLDMPWYAEATGAEDLIFTLNAPTAVQALHLHDVNFANADIYKSADGVAYTFVGTMQTYCGKEGRRRGRITIADPNVKALKASTAAGATTDGKAYRRCGAGYVFGSVLTVGSPFQFDFSSRFIYPQVSTQLANKQPAIAATGTPFHEIVVPYKPFDTEDLEPAITQARAGTPVLLDLAADLVNYPGLVWPCRILEEEMTERYGEPRTSELTLKFTEAV